MSAREEVEAHMRQVVNLQAMGHRADEFFVLLNHNKLLDTLCAEERAKALKEVWDRTQGEQMPMGFLAWLAVNAEKPR